MAGTVAGGKRPRLKTYKTIRTSIATSDELAVETATQEALRPTRSWRELPVLRGADQPSPIKKSNHEQSR